MSREENYDIIQETILDWFSKRLKQRNDEIKLAEDVKKVKDKEMQDNIGD